MTIRTYQSFSGYIATEPSREPTRDGTPRFYARAGQRQGQKEPDGAFTKLPTQYMPIVALGDAAEEAAQLGKGDRFTAEGRIRQVRYEKDGKTAEGEEFEVWKIGRRPGEPARAEQMTTAASRDVPAEFAAPQSRTSSASALAL